MMCSISSLAEWDNGTPRLAQIHDAHLKVIWLVIYGFTLVNGHDAIEWPMWVTGRIFMGCSEQDVQDSWYCAVWQRNPERRKIHPSMIAYVGSQIWPFWQNLRKSTVYGPEWIPPMLCHSKWIFWRIIRKQSFTFRAGLIPSHNSHSPHCNSADPLTIAKNASIIPSPKLHSSYNLRQSL
jgi:hypothetical protein